MEEKFSQLDEILILWDKTHSASSLTEEQRKYLSAFYNGLIASKNPSYTNMLLEKYKSLFESPHVLIESQSRIDPMKIGKIQFDCRLLNPEMSYSLPFDENEKQFIENGTLNEKELLYLQNHEKHDKMIKQQEIEHAKSESQIENEIHAWLEEIRKKDLMEVLENYVSKFGISIGHDFYKFKQLLEQYHVDTNFPHIREALFVIDKKLRYADFLKQILSNKPISSNDYIKNFLEIYGEHYQKQIPFLEKFLVEKGFSISDLSNQIDVVKSKIDLKQFESALRMGQNVLVISDCNNMKGHEFEKLVGELFHRMGYVVQYTKGSGDQGSDLIIEKFGKKKTIQCKRSGQKISNKAVQETVSAIKHYKADSGMVVTNNFFHKSALDLAKSNYIELIDRTALEKWLTDNPITKDYSNSVNVQNQENLDKNGLPLLMDEIFMKIIYELEGNERKPIPERLLVKNLIKTGKFTESSSKSMIWNMMAEQIYQSSEDHYNSLTPELKTKLEEEEKNQQSKVSKMQIFFQTLKNLEGENKMAVPIQTLIDALVKSEFFTKEESFNYIQRMLREVIIYESKPEHFNSI